MGESEHNSLSTLSRETTNLTSKYQKPDNLFYKMVLNLLKHAPEKKQHFFPIIRGKNWSSQ